MTRRFRFNAIAAALTPIALPPGALAQDAREQQLPEVRVQSDREVGGYSAPTATTATKIEALLGDIPQTVNVVPQELLRDQSARSIQDALRNVPGVGLSHGDGQRDQVTMRGYSAIGDQFIDGMRERYDPQLNLYNPFDKQYIVSGHGSAPTLNLPGAPRSVQLTARFRF